MSGVEEGAAVAGAAGGGAAGGSALTPEVAGWLLAGGTAAQMLAAQQQAQQQRKILNRAFERNDKATGEGTKQVLDLAKDAAPGNQAAAIQAAQDASAQRTMSDIKGAGADLIDSASKSGRMSGEFQQAKQAAQAAEGDRLSAIAQEVGRARAPGAVVADEAMKRSALAERLGSMFSSNRQAAQAAQLEAQGVDRPWYGDVGQIASLVGGIGLAGGAGTAASPAATGATNPALIESAAGTAGYGASSAVPASMAGRTALAQALAQWGQQRSRQQQPLWYGR